MQDKWINILLRQSRKRSIKSGMAFNITKEYLARMWESQGGKCALTGIAFVDTDEAKHSRRPYIPSIDRKDCKVGYVKGNVRLVCVAVNMALFTWGDEVFDHIVRERYKFLATSQNIDIPLTFPSPQESQLMSRGAIEGVFKLSSGCINARQKLGLPVPPIHSTLKHGDCTWYKYDVKAVAEWIKTNKEILTFKIGNVAS